MVKDGFKKTVVSEVPQSNRKDKSKPNGKAELPFITNPVDMAMSNDKINAPDNACGSQSLLPKT